MTKTSYLSLLIAGTFVIFNGNAFAKTRTVDLTAGTLSIEIDMAKVDSVNARVKSEGGAPEVSFDKEADRNLLCDNVSVSITRDHDNYLITLTPEFSLDDGENACEVKIKRPSGKTSVVTMTIGLDG